MPCWKYKSYFFSKREWRYTSMHLSEHLVIQFMGKLILKLYFQIAYVNVKSLVCFLLLIFISAVPYLQSSPWSCCTKGGGGNVISKWFRRTSLTEDLLCPLWFIYTSDTKRHHYEPILQSLQDVQPVFWDLITIRRRRKRRRKSAWRVSLNYAPTATRKTRYLEIYLYS